MRRTTPELKDNRLNSAGRDGAALAPSLRAGGALRGTCCPPKRCLLNLLKRDPNLSRIRIGVVRLGNHPLTQVTISVTFDALGAYMAQSATEVNGPARTRSPVPGTSAPTEALLAPASRPARLVGAWASRGRGLEHDVRTLVDSCRKAIRWPGAHLVFN